MIEESINQIFKEWNPLEVPSFIAEDEYRSYIPDIIQNIYDKYKLKSYLKDMIENKMGLVLYNSNDLSDVVESIHNLID